LFSLDSDDFLRALPLLLGLVGAGIASFILYGRRSGKRQAKKKKLGKSKSDASD
jgi:hypothetical protein